MTNDPFRPPSVPVNLSIAVYAAGPSAVPAINSSAELVPSSSPPVNVFPTVARPSWIEPVSSYAAWSHWVISNAWVNFIMAPPVSLSTACLSAPTDSSNPRTLQGMGDDTEFRIEHDTMGEVKVPRDALWRAQTQRAVENFPISGRPLAPELVHALAQIKASAAVVN